MRKGVENEAIWNGKILVKTVPLEQGLASARINATSSRITIVGKDSVTPTLKVEMPATSRRKARRAKKALTEFEKGVTINTDTPGKVDVTQVDVPPTERKFFRKREKVEPRTATLLLEVPTKEVLAYHARTESAIHIENVKGSGNDETKNQAISANGDIAVLNSSGSLEAEIIEGDGRIYLRDHHADKGLVSLTTNDGIIDVSFTDAIVHAESDKGTVMFENTEGTITAITDSGDIIFENNLNGDRKPDTVRFKTKSGSIFANGISGTADLEVETGEISVERSLLYGESKAKTDTGDVSFSLAKHIPGYSIDVDVTGPFEPIQQHIGNGSELFSKNHLAIEINANSSDSQGKVSVR